MECQQGPNLPSRFLLMAFNYLVLMITSTYLILFSAKVISNKYVFPYNNTEDICKYGPDIELAGSHDITTHYTQLVSIQINIMYELCMVSIFLQVTYGIHCRTPSRVTIPVICRDLLFGDTYCICHCVYSLYTQR